MHGRPVGTDNSAANLILDVARKLLEESKPAKQPA